MKIVTINVPEAYLEAIEHLVGDKGLFPSRSELIRVAVREFLIKEIGMAKAIKEHPKIKDYSEEYDKTKIVRVPIHDSNPDAHFFKKFKTYKIIKRLG